MIPGLPIPIQPALEQSNASVALYAFGQALFLSLDDNSGVVVDLKQGMIFQSSPHARKIIVYKAKGGIHVDPFFQDIKEGTIITIKEKDGSTTD